MLTRSCGWTVVLLALVAQPLAARAEATLSYADLLRRMTDLERLAVLPLPDETAAQCSSYDRASKYDAKTGKYVDWGANNDSNGCIRKEGKQIVMAEMEGPGCIWRIWSALAQNGHVKIYLDGQTTPAVNLPYPVFFRLRRPVQPSDAFLRPRADALCRAERVHADSVPEVVQDRGRRRLGSVLSFHVRFFPQGDRWCRPSAPPWPQRTPRS